MNRFFKNIILVFALFIPATNIQAATKQTKAASFASVVIKNALTHLALVSENPSQAINVLRTAHVAGIVEGLLMLLNAYQRRQIIQTSTIEEGLVSMAASSIIMNHIVGLCAHWTKVPQAKDLKKLRPLLYLTYATDMTAAGTQLASFNQLTTMGRSEMKILSQNLLACIDALQQMLLNKDNTSLAMLHSAFAVANAGGIAYGSYKIATTPAAIPELADHSAETRAERLRNQPDQIRYLAQRCPDLQIINNPNGRQELVQELTRKGAIGLADDGDPLCSICAEQDNVITGLPFVILPCHHANCLSCIHTIATTSLDNPTCPHCREAFGR